MRGIKNSYSHELNFWPYVEKRGEEDCWPWKGTTQKAGYGHVWRNGRPYGAHRISWEIANGIFAPRDKWVLHKCDNPNCVNPTHLFLGTPRDNHRDQINKGRRPMIRPFSKHPELKKHGEDTSGAKLKESDVRMIRKLWALGTSQRELARRNNVCQSTISLIIRRLRWSHI